MRPLRSLSSARFVVLLSASLVGESVASAQNEHAMDMEEMTGPLGIPLTREGSGTSWQPDASPMAAIHARAAGWLFMVHGNVFLNYDVQGSARGDSQVDSINWLMVMARHALGPGELSARAMLSLEPLTVGGGGYPLLLQTGETWHGVPLHDHQHPHDLFTETALAYAVPVSNDVALQFYGAPAGEPALGPVAFPHRTSARSDPMAPIGHHWEDSTHISYGVLTAGVFTRTWKLEGSWFNGREPDEDRYDFDLRVPDSASARLTVNPAPPWSMQVSYGYLSSPEALRPGEAMQRVTASAALDVPIFDEGHWASLALFGLNAPSDAKVTPAWLLESNADPTKHHTIFGRAELVTKSGDDLVLTPNQAAELFPMASVTLGYELRLLSVAHLVPAIGASGTVDVVGSELSAFYGTRTPLGGVVFLHLRPEDMPMDEPAHGSTMGASALRPVVH